MQRPETQEAIVAEETLQLVQATHKEMADRWRHHFHAWGKGLTLELYLRREEALNDGEFCRKSVRMWLLKNAAEEILASCETYATRLWHGEAEGDLHQLKAESVASVLVEPKLRNQGHAATLMRQLGMQLQQEGVMAAMLYSDVGPGLYRRAGYMLHPARESVREVADEPWPETAEEIGLQDVADLLKHEAQHVPARLAMTSAPSVIEVPSAAHIGWFHQRSQFRAWARERPPLESVGVRAPDGGFMLWTADASEPVLHSLLWRPRSAKDAAILAQAAMAEAREHGLERVVWWDADRDTGLDPFRDPELQPPRTIAQKRESSLPMLAWLEETPGQPTRPMPMVWGGIERFGWV